MIPLGLAIRSWHVLAERSVFNETVVAFSLSHQGGPECQLWLAMGPDRHPPPILRAWRHVPGEGSSSVNPEAIPFTIRDLAQTVCQQISRR